MTYGFVPIIKELVLIKDEKALARCAELAGLTVPELLDNVFGKWKPTRNHDRRQIFRGAPDGARREDQAVDES